MTTRITVLLVLAILAGTSFAGYSTGFRRTPKPSNPRNPQRDVRPIVYPVIIIKEGDPQWRETHDHPVGTGKNNEGGIDKVGSGGPDKNDKIGIDQGQDIPKDNTKVIGSNTGSGHWVPSQDESPAEEKKVPHGFPEVSGEQDIPAKLDEKSVIEEKHPHVPDEVPPKDYSIQVEEKQPSIDKPDKGHGGGDLPEKIPQPHPDNPKSIGEEKVSINPHGDSHEKPPGYHPGEGDQSSYIPDGTVDDSKHKDTDENVHPQPYPGNQKSNGDEVVPKNPHEEPSGFHPEKGDPSINIPGGVVDDDSTYKDSNEKVYPQPHPDNPKVIGDDKVPINPHDVSHEKPSGFHPEKGDPSINIPGGTGGDDSNYEDTNQKVYPEIEPNKDDGVAIGPLPYPEFPTRDKAIVPPDFQTDDKSISAIGPQPSPEFPPRESAIIPPGAKTEVLEPYPMKVAGANGNINLYELMEKLELSRFLHLVEEAGLKDLLTGEGPLTIFAPSDFALSKLDADTIRKLATNKELLRQFVLYHCVDGQIYGPSFEERDNSAMTTKFDGSIHINNYGKVWYVNGIPIISRDQTCKNGVIHVLDNSLYPFPTGDLLETLEKLENFKIYTELIRNAKLEKELKGEVVYTIFAPTDAAFSKLPPANLEWLKWDIPAIKRMFRQLTVSGMYYTRWIPSGNGQLSSIDEETKLSLSGYPDAINVNGVGLTQYDITASNGCIHAIDDIWFLSELGTPSSSSSQKKHD